MEDSVEQSSAPTESEYTVVARRYRPRSFEQLIGQEHVAQALAKAVATGRVGHAYLFTGARGVGKTSTARIFAKTLNTPEGSDPELIAEISAAIDSGDDMDVIEIDGASNRGINEIRQLRANVNVRPSRARFKIYIIDEVHMLTKEAFNALLKTLEEPPQHVKFIFCTTDPEKIPITVLSRCQRFDFAPVKFEAIMQRLAEIATNEGFEYEPDAIALLARRAAGSMRDSQSLLEQVMSFSIGKITAEQVHALLGIADESQLFSIVQSLQQHDALAAITAVDLAIAAGADAGQLTEQLLNYLRDVMTVGIGGGTQLLKVASPLSHPRLQQLACQWGLAAILSAIQILDESLVRMRASVSAATLLEVALVQVCQLQHLESIPALIAALGSVPGSPATHQKKKPSDSTAVVARTDAAHSVQSPNINVPTTFDGQPTLVVVAPEPIQAQSPVAARLQVAEPVIARRPTSAQPLSTAQSLSAPPPAAQLSAKAVVESVDSKSDDSKPVDSKPVDSNSGMVGQASDRSRNSPAIAEASLELQQWRQATRAIEGLLSDYCAMVELIEVREPGIWRVVFPPGAVQPRDYCDNVGRKSQLNTALAAEVGRAVQLQFEVLPGAAPSLSRPNSASSTAERTKRIREIANEPLIKKIIEVLDGEIIKVVPPKSASNTNKAPTSHPSNSIAHS